MSSISRLFTTTFTVYRQTWVLNKSTDVLVGTFNGHIQKADIGISAQLEGGFTKAYTIWCNLGTDVSESDTLVDSDSKTYSVKIVRELNEGTNRHMRLIAQRDK